MAFSFAGMANQIEETKVETTAVKEANCGLKYLDDCQRLEDMGLPPAQAQTMTFNNYKRCAGL